MLTRQMKFASGTTREDLKVAVDHLMVGTADEVTIDSIDAGPIMTNDEGEGHLFLSTADTPGAELLPPALQDFSRLVEAHVNDSSGTTMLKGRFAEGRTSDREGPRLDLLGVAILKDSSSQVVGMATPSITGSVQELSLSVWGLTPGQTCSLVIFGGTVGDLIATLRGRNEAQYSSAPTGEDLQLPDSLVPVSGLMHPEH